MSEAAVVIPGMVDAGGGADSGAADSGAEPVEEIVTGDETGTDDQVDGSQDQENADDQSGDKTDNEADKKGVIANFKDTYKALKEVNPQAAEQYRKAHFGFETYQKAFPTPAAATEAKQIFEDLGGPEGIESLQSDAQEFATELTQFAEGNPELLSKLSAESPEGYAKLATPYLETLHKTNPEAYNAALAPIISNTLESWGVTAAIMEAGNVLSKIYQTQKAAGNTAGLYEIEKAYDKLKTAFDSAESLKSTVEKAKTAPQDGKVKELTAREQALQKKEHESFMQAAQSTISARMNSSISKVLAPYMKGKTLTLEQKQDLADGIYDHISAQLKSNKKYRTQLQSLLSGRDQNKVATFVMQNVDRLVAGSVKQIWNRRGFGALPNAAKPGAQANAGVTNLTKRPKHDDVDWNKTSDIQWMSGEAYLKGSGKKVSFKWDAQ